MTESTDLTILTENRFLESFSSSDGIFDTAFGARLEFLG